MPSSLADKTKRFETRRGRRAWNADCGSHGEFGHRCAAAETAERELQMVEQDTLLSAEAVIFEAQ
eukprot:12356868-Alexandrium_andersonii.AAC.1